MTRERFTHAMRLAAEAARAFAATMVTDDLPAECRFVVFLNQSCDDTLSEGEFVYPNDPLRVGNLTHSLTLDQVVDLLWRDSRVPEWIDMSACRTTPDFTLLSLMCCGRFTDHPDLLYYADSAHCPFGIKSPNLPFDLGDPPMKFALNSTRLPSCNDL